MRSLGIIIHRMTYPNRDLDRVGVTIVDDEDGTVGRGYRARITHSLREAIDDAKAKPGEIWWIALSGEHYYSLRDREGFILKMLGDYSKTSQPLGVSDIIDAARFLGHDWPEFILIKRSIFG